MSLDGAITCCGRSWGSECQICEEKAYQNYLKTIEDNAYQDYLKTIEDNDGGDSDGVIRKD
jgi:hypothetical protein